MTGEQDGALPSEQEMADEHARLVTGFVQAVMALDDSSPAPFVFVHACAARTLGVIVAAFEQRVAAEDGEQTPIPYEEVIVNALRSGAQAARREMGRGDD